MYLIDKDSNKLIKVEKKTFKSLGLDERHNLQEWIAKEPSSLGEDLLIIQKEFDGFADTKERLDLLAIDKSGNLVITTSSTEVSYPLATIQRYEYDSVDDDIDELAPEAGNDVHVLRDGNTLTLTNLREGTTASLYGSNGQLLETFKGQGRPVIISVDARPDGVYMVKTGNQTFKLIKQ